MPKFDVVYWGQNAGERTTEVINAPSEAVALKKATDNFIHTKYPKITIRKEGLFSVKEETYKNPHYVSMEGVSGSDSSENTKGVATTSNTSENTKGVVTTSNSSKNAKSAVTTSNHDTPENLRLLQEQVRLLQELKSSNYKIYFWIRACGFIGYMICIYSAIKLIVEIIKAN